MIYVPSVLLVAAWFCGLVMGSSIGNKKLYYIYAVLSAVVMYLLVSFFGRPA